jgi:hypothetical protein
MRLLGGKAERLQDDILGIPECAALQALVNDDLDFGPGDMDGHGFAFVSVFPPYRPIFLRSTD